MLLTCRLYLIGRILFWLHSLFLQFYRTVVCLSCITVCIFWRWPYSYFVSWWILWVCNPIRPPLFGCVLNALWYSFTKHLCHSILAIWLAIWFSAEFGYSSPLCVRSLATLPFVIKTKTNKQKTKLKGKIYIPAQTSINLLLVDSYRLDILSYLSGIIWHLALP